MKKVFLTFILFSLSVFGHEIELWHAFDSFLEEKFCEIVAEFNRQPGNPQIKLVQKSDYKTAHDEGLKAHKEGKGPHILQVYEIATLSMMLQEDLFFPLEDLMKQYQCRFDPDVYIDIVRKFYSAPNGKMLSLPWNASTGVLYYNKKAFKNAGLDPDKPPKTWPELEKMGEKLKKAGYSGFTTAWPVGYHLEHVCCLHDVPFATKENGFGGLGARLIFHQGPLVFHIKKVAEWSKKGIFSYSGRYTATPEERFVKGECAILMQGANRYPNLKRQADFEIGIGFIPYWPHLSSKPLTLNLGGASFWVLKGFSDEDYQGIAKFFSYLSSAEVQAEWHQSTGYLPITEAAYYLTKKKDFYKTHPAAEIAVLEVLSQRPTVNSWGIRLGNYVRIRDIIMDQLEKAFIGEISAEEALNKAAEEGNHILEVFEKEHSSS